MMVQEFHHFGYLDWLGLLIGCSRGHWRGVAMDPARYLSRCIMPGCVVLAAVGTHVASHDAPLAAVPLGVLMFLTVVGYIRWPQALPRNLTPSDRGLARLGHTEAMKGANRWP